DHALVVGISQSGQSPDVVSVVEEARRQGRPTIAFTNDPASPLAKTSDHVFDLCKSPEHAIAATKTYTTQLAAVALLGAALGGDKLAVIAESPAGVPGMAISIPLAASVPEWLSPISAVLPGQLLALELVLAKGLDPDRPRGLPEKVVKTT